MSKVYVFLAEGFEEIEGLTVVDILRRAGVETEMVSVGEKKAVTGSHGITVEADRMFAEIVPETCEMFVLPGGMPGTRYLAAHEGLTELLKKAAADGKKIAAICAAPSVPGGLGLLKGHKAACYPGFEDKLEGAEVVYEPVVISGNMTTSRGMGTAIEFALALTAQLVNEEKAEELAKGIIYKL